MKSIYSFEDIFGTWCLGTIQVFYWVFAYIGSCSLLFNMFRQIYIFLHNFVIHDL